MVAVATGGVNLYKARLDGMDVAGFESNDYFGFVVSDLGQNVVTQMAVGLAPPLRNALGGRIGTDRSAAPAPALYLHRALLGTLNIPDSIGA